MKSCPRCHTQLPEEARFCLNCGAPQPPAAPPPPSEGGLRWRGELLPQFNEYFLQALRERIAQVSSVDQLPEYTERLYQSGFRDTVHRRLIHLAERLERARAEVGWSQRRAENELRNTVEALLDFFIIHHGRDLNPVFLCEDILKYQEARWESVDLFQMVLDYLDFAREPVRVYTDFIRMPPEKIRNAGQSFLFPARDEPILLICDQSLFGSFKEGFALTDVALYWKATLQPAHSVYYKNLDALDMKKDYLLINGEFFDANPSLNVKMLLLLQKLRRLNQQE